MLPRKNSYEEVLKAFRWEIPKKYNMARDVCDRHATAAGQIFRVQPAERFGPVPLAIAEPSSRSTT